MLLSLLKKYITLSGEAPCWFVLEPVKTSVHASAEGKCATVAVKLLSTNARRSDRGLSRPHTFVYPENTSLNMAQRRVPSPRFSRSAPGAILGVIHGAQMTKVESSTQTPEGITTEVEKTGKKMQADRSVFMEMPTAVRKGLQPIADRTTRTTTGLP